LPLRDRERVDPQELCQLLLSHPQRAADLDDLVPCHALLIAAAVRPTTPRNAIATPRGVAVKTCTPACNRLSDGSVASRWAIHRPSGMSHMWMRLPSGSDRPQSSTCPTFIAIDSRCKPKREGCTWNATSIRLPAHKAAQCTLNHCLNQYIGPRLSH